VCLFDGARGDAANQLTENRAYSATTGTMARDSEASTAFQSVAYCPRTAEYRA